MEDPKEVNKYVPTAEEQEAHEAGIVAAEEAEIKRLAEPKALVSVTPNGFLHQEELLRVIIDLNNRIAALEAEAGK